MPDLYLLQSRSLSFYIFIHQPWVDSASAKLEKPVAALQLAQSQTFEKSKTQQRLRRGADIHLNIKTISSMASKDLPIDKSLPL